MGRVIAAELINTSLGTFGLLLSSSKRGLQSVVGLLEVLAPAVVHHACHEVWRVLVEDLVVHLLVGRYLIEQEQIEGLLLRAGLILNLLRARELLLDVVESLFDELF